MVVCPKKEKAQSRDVRVKSWLERSISHLEGGGANKMGFLHERKINRCELHNSSDADLGRHPATTDIQRSAGPSKRQASIAAPRTLSRRTADDGPDEREGEVDGPNTEEGRNWSCHNCVPVSTHRYLSGVGVPVGAGRPARPFQGFLTTSISISTWGGCQTEDGVESCDDGGRVYPTRSSSH